MIVSLRVISFSTTFTGTIHILYVMLLGVSYCCCCSMSLLGTMIVFTVSYSSLTGIAAPSIVSLSLLTSTGFIYLDSIVVIGGELSIPSIERLRIIAVECAG
jgi:hypothetical protein